MEHRGEVILNLLLFGKTPDIENRWLIVDGGITADELEALTHISSQLDVERREGRINLKTDVSPPVFCINLSRVTAFLSYYVADILDGGNRIIRGLQGYCSPNEGGGLVVPELRPYVLSTLLEKSKNREMIWDHLGGVEQLGDEIPIYNRPVSVEFIKEGSTTSAMSYTRLTSFDELGYRVLVSGVKSGEVSTFAFGSIGAMEFDSDKYGRFDLVAPIHPGTLIESRLRITVEEQKKFPLGSKKFIVVSMKLVRENLEILSYEKKITKETHLIPEELPLSVTTESHFEELKKSFPNIYRYVEEFITMVKLEGWYRDSKGLLSFVKSMRP